MILIVIFIITGSVAGAIYWRTHKEWPVMVILGVGMIAEGLANQTLPHRIVNATMMAAGLILFVAGLVRRQKDSKRSRLSK